MNDVLPDRPELGFTAEPLDRADPVRKDPDKLEALWRSDAARVAVFWREMPFALATRAGPREAAFVRPDALKGAHAGAPVFLGLDGEAPVFAVALAPEREPGDDFLLHGMGDFEELRGLAMQIDARDAGVLAAGRSLLSWHARHGFCANCGAATRVSDGGWKRSCPSCAVDHFPRVDPVAIMAVGHDGKLLLGRQANWPKGFWSCLAGYVEPGETLEQATRREVFEEAGVRVGAVRYVASQPWPYPSSLMIGVLCDGESEEITIDAHEIEDARWFSREEARAMLAGDAKGFMAPPPLAIAHHLMRHWVEEG